MSGGWWQSKQPENFKECKKIVVLNFDLKFPNVFNFFYRSHYIIFLIIFAINYQKVFTEFRWQFLPKTIETNLICATQDSYSHGI